MLCNFRDVLSLGRVVEMGKKKAQNFGKSESFGRENRRAAHREKISERTLTPSSSSLGLPCEITENIDEEEGDSQPSTLSVNICLWEFGQNDPKR